MPVWQVPDSKHAWAFVYYCRRQGDRVKVYRCAGKLIILVNRTPVRGVSRETKM